MTGAMSRRGVLVSAGALCISACGPGRARRDVLTALAGSANLETNGVWVWMSAFAERLRVAGLSVEVTTNSALGGEADRTELTSLGDRKSVV